MNSSKDREAKVPTHRFSRLAGLGRVTTSIAARTALESVKRLGRAEVPNLPEILLTRRNILDISDELSRMRGAALKLGQLISMDAGDFMPPELVDILERLRADANFMPADQLNTVLVHELGENWRTKFKDFDMRPIAAASIGQVHRATLTNGKKLAVKVQFPGIAKTIDSDIENVMTLFRVTGLAPPRHKLEPIIAETKKQLHREADYKQEAEHINRFNEILSGSECFMLPSVQTELTTGTVLSMSYVPGYSIDNVADEPEETRNSVFESLIRLALDEFFKFAFTQTDPNFANYTFDRDTGKIGLLDFGAMRKVDHQKIEVYRLFLGAGLKGDRNKLRQLGCELSFYKSETDPHHRYLIDRLIVHVFAAIRQNKKYSFSDGELIEQINALGSELAVDKTFDHVPPADFVFLQRKAIGLYLLGRRLRATIPLIDILEDYI